ncbi:hypothetical protein PHLGIDRAFT_418452 [Phlebiopsis gigantea 11061_1 CR5-6]|uniref:21S rRNA pseudouridine(2819) synthase n=1 Tax=Phlebiopsis gigantea (strain 11061_1 CR5-6) TaxID=745531 RepID=A0A0C3PVI3_PHLG1|nr:hypothetical protein PHLGIDRAFT_418452 [Phlebiopsis gigantea 11061_1 CR5-6]
MLLAWAYSCRRWTRSTYRTYSTAHNQAAIYNDKNVIVLNKPPGFHSQLKGGKPDVLDLLHDYTDESGNGIWVCHRLDKLTTGALLCAKTASAAKELNLQFKQRDVEKTYLALVSSPRSLAKSGTISQPLMQANGNVSVWQEDSGRQKIEAVTDYDVLDTSRVAPVALLRFRPKTGRKHQIRVHSANVLNSPILGDDRHMKIEDSARAETLKLPSDTLFLHSAYISCYRYSRGKPRFRLGVAAPLQASFVNLCRQLEISIPTEYMRGGVYLNGTHVEDGIVTDVNGSWLL